MFYPKLALTNIKKNRKVYLPYILACIMTIAMFYIMVFITEQDATGKGTLYFVMQLGSIVIGLFSFCIVIYTNSFLMKRRKKEIGLYNILGMGKRHIAKVMSLETLIIAFGTVITGIAVGILLSKLMLLLLLRILDFEVRYGFEISGYAISTTCILFAVIFGLTLLNNIRQVTLAQPIELLYGGNVGEKEPKTKWIMTILGAAALGTGYYIAITTQNPLKAIMLFFVAVILVIFGTYCLFTAGSIALLKFMKKRKSYYYKTKHFTSVSGMLYRMKQNAAGLSNICILSTMVLVMVSTTTSMVLGYEDTIRTQHPRNIIIELSNADEKINPEIDAAVKKVLADKGLEMINPISYSHTDYVIRQFGNTAAYEDDNSIYFDEDNVAAISVLTLDEYNRLMGTDTRLEENEVLFYSDDTEWGYDIFKVGDTEYRIREVIDELKVVESSFSHIVDTMYFVVKDEAVNKAIDNVLTYKDKSLENIRTYYYGFDVDTDTDTEYKVFSDLKKEIETGTSVSSFKENKDAGSFSINCEVQSREEFLMLNGSLFFLGIFLGTLFLMATVLIIYYKQISEGYDDKQRFTIMQKVGMSKGEIKKTIRSQVLIVFFLPLACACIHIVAAFNMIKRLLSVIGLMNTSLFIMCTLGTVAVFAILYAIVYIITSRTYYKIVGEV